MLEAPPCPSLPTQRQQHAGPANGHDDHRHDDPPHHHGRCCSSPPSSVVQVGNSADVLAICSATGMSPSVAAAALAAAGGERDHAILRLHRNAVTRRVLAGSAAGSKDSPPSSLLRRRRQYLWVGECHGVGITYPKPHSSKTTTRLLDNYVQLVVQAGAKSYTSTAVRRSVSPRWTFAIPAALPEPTTSGATTGATAATAAAVPAAPATAQQEIRLSLCTMAGEPIATATVAIPFEGEGNAEGTTTTPRTPLKAKLHALSPGASSICGELIIDLETSTSSRTNNARTPTSISTFPLAVAGGTELAADDTRRTLFPDGRDGQTAAAIIGRAATRSASAPCESEEFPTIQRARANAISTLDAYHASSIKAYLDTQTEGTPVECPKCAAVFLFESGSATAAPCAADGIGCNGKPIEGDALAAYNALRARCPSCEESFCASCKTAPFHSGKQCGQAADRFCRFCEELLVEPESQEAYADLTSAYPSCVGLFANPLPIWVKEVEHPALKDVCKSDECAERAAKSCLKLHATCQHACGGVRDECTCLPCLRCSEEDGVCHDDLCTACFTEGLSAAPAIKLDSCGHYLHAHCAKQQIERAWGETPTLNFGFLECNICRVTMEHELLKDSMKPHLELRAGVHALAKQQVEQELEAMSADDKEKVTDEGELQYALRSYEFKMCFKCQTPYFAGRHDCAGGAAADEMPAEQPEDAICSGCRDSSAGVSNCERHGKSHIMWKCRYCCEGLATYECFTYFHACHSCHEYSKLETLINFSHKVGAGDPLRGGVPGDDRVYANRKQLWEYPQCLGPESCNLGCAHPPHGLEFCFGCSKCAEEAQYARDKLPEAMLLLQKMPAKSRFLDGLEDIENEMDRLGEVDQRLKQCLWLFGNHLLANDLVSKRDVISGMQRVCDTQFLKKHRLKGQPKALAKSKKLAEIVAAFNAWKAIPLAQGVVQEMYRNMKVCAEWTVEEQQKYAVPGRKQCVVSARQNVTFNLNLKFFKNAAADNADDENADAACDTITMRRDGYASTPLSEFMVKAAERQTKAAARKVAADAADAEEEEAAALAGGGRQKQQGSIGFAAPVAALALFLGDRGGSCTGFVDANGTLCGTVPLSSMIDEGCLTATVYASVAAHTIGGSLGSGDEFAEWWKLL